MYYDVYLGGITSPQWRKDFKSQISSDISVFDPYLDKLNEEDKIEQIARELYFIEQCEIVVFCLNSEKTSKSSRLQLGDAVGHDKQVIVCLDGNVEGSSYVEKYCEYRGVVVVFSVEDLVRTVEEYVAEVELCNFDDDTQS